MQQTQTVRENICVFFPEGLSSLDFLSEIIKYWLTFWEKKKMTKITVFLAIDPLHGLQVGQVQGVARGIFRPHLKAKSEFLRIFFSQCYLK